MASTVIKLQKEPLIERVKAWVKLTFLPRERRIYVVLHGRYKGEWLVKVSEGVYFSLPDKYIRKMPQKEFEWGIKNKVLEAVDVLPKGVYNVCLAEYNLKVTDEQYNNALNRREQHLTQNTLDSE